MCYQDRAPYSNIFFLLQKSIYGIVGRNQIHPNINGFKAKILIKCETEKYIGRVNKKDGIFEGEMGKLSVQLMSACSLIVMYNNNNNIIY